MAEVHIVDIDGEQWDIKDLPLTTRVENLEAKTAKNFEYSTTEQEIGKWLDGKKHYRLIITGRTTTRVASVNLSDRNIAEVTKISGTLKARNEYAFPLPYYYVEDVENLNKFFSYVYYDFRRGVLDLLLGQATYFDDVTFNIEIDYTKNS